MPMYQLKSPIKAVYRIDVNAPSTWPPGATMTESKHCNGHYRLLMKDEKGKEDQSLQDGMAVIVRVNGRIDIYGQKWLDDWFEEVPDQLDVKLAPGEPIVLAGNKPDLVELEPITTPASMPVVRVFAMQYTGHNGGTISRWTKGVFFESGNVFPPALLVAKPTGVVAKEGHWIVQNQPGMYLVLSLGELQTMYRFVHPQATDTEQPTS